MIAEILLDHSEKANKCTIVPQIKRADFKIILVKKEPKPWNFISPFLLHHEGKCLSELKSSSSNKPQSIALIDSVWKRLPYLLQNIQTPLPILISIPKGFTTAYPRRSKDNSDPQAGLATIEALFIAQVFLGNCDISLLNQYFFGREFLLKNKEAFLRYGLLDIAPLFDDLQYFGKTTNSKARRMNRTPGTFYT